MFVQSHPHIKEYTCTVLHKLKVASAAQALQFQRSLEDMEQWVGSVEKELTVQDCGTDLQSVSRLLKSLQGLEEVVDGHQERIQVGGSGERGVR